MAHIATAAASLPVNQAPVSLNVWLAQWVWEHISGSLDSLVTSSYSWKGQEDCTGEREEAYEAASGSKALRQVLQHFASAHPQPGRLLMEHSPKCLAGEPSVVQVLERMVHCSVDAGLQGQIATVAYVTAVEDLQARLQFARALST